MKAQIDIDDVKGVRVVTSARLLSLLTPMVKGCKCMYVLTIHTYWSNGIRVSKELIKIFKLGSLPYLLEIHIYASVFD